MPRPAVEILYQLKLMRSVDLESATVFDVLLCTFPDFNVQLCNKLIMEWEQKGQVLIYVGSGDDAGYYYGLLEGMGLPVLIDPVD